MESKKLVLAPPARASRMYRLRSSAQAAQAAAHGGPTEPAEPKSSQKWVILGVPRTSENCVLV